MNPPPYPSARSTAGAASWPGDQHSPAPGIGGPPTPLRHTVPRGFGGVVVVGILYVLAYPGMLILQTAYAQGEFFSGRTTPVTQIEVTVTFIVLGVVSFLLSGLPAILIAAGRGTRPDGRTISARLVWIPVALAIGLIAVTVAPNDGALQPGYMAPAWPNFVTATAVLAAWLSTRRASRWALLAAPVGGALAVGCSVAMAQAVNDLGRSSRSAGLAEQLEAVLSGPEVPYGQIFVIVLFGSLGVVAAMVAGAWLGFGIDKLSATVSRRALPDEPESMWRTVSGPHRRAIHAALSALAIAFLIPATSAVAAGTWHAVSVGSAALGVLVCVMLALAINAAASPERRPFALFAVAAMVVFALLGVLVELANTRDGQADWAVQLSRHLFLVACTVGFILVLARSLWGLVAAPLAFAASWSGLPGTPLGAYTESAGVIFLDTLVLAATIAVGVGVSWVVGYVASHPEMLGVGRPAGPVAGAHQAGPSAPYAVAPQHFGPPAHTPPPSGPTPHPGTVRPPLTPQSGAPATAFGAPAFGAPNQPPLPAGPGRVAPPSVSPRPSDSINEIVPTGDPGYGPTAHFRPPTG